ncbi:MAG TPA: CoA transferase [candidate division Zixibacteria bacterium]|nr:CoA transferase [candidate division Zixibacteria bacterium]
MTRLPLEGIRVVELTTGAAGPTVARVLCEFGAEVIRCETRLRGDGHRGEDPALWNKKPDFIKLQRGKKSFTVNMQTEKGRELVRELLRKADVLVENFGLGVLEKWGLDYPRLREINPRCILIRVKGMGCTGPHAADLTYGPNVGNTMGTTYLWNYPGATTATAEPRTQHPDFMGGVTGAFAVVLALIHRKKTGRGQWIDSAQVEIGASLLGPRYLEYSVNGTEPRPTGNHSLVAAPYGAYRCAGNDRWCVISVEREDEWQRFAALLERAGLEPDPRFATHLGRVRHRDDLDRWVTSWTSRHDPYHVMETLQAIGVCAAVVQDVEDQFERDPQYRATGFLVALNEPEAGKVVTEGVPVRLSETPGRVRGPAPLMGEHTREIARNLLGLSDAEIARLEEERVLY